jgi:hypothetical protein
VVLVNAATLTKRDVAACVADLAAIDAEVNTLNTIVSTFQGKAVYTYHFISLLASPALKATVVLLVSTTPSKLLKV